ncbi:MarR family transcriptional regulator [Cryobacterium sp. GrIS_2_6]|uniref:MarR family winged helix-turn-helix transcriptional regulator n=1 Tax=Cryobacterium sp. GrIS_2_6 TaxID=3162785 RepID=UPI002E017828|nr:MarR family transcriptional regulator [Cryobacterium psychrotolerans]MEC5152560.1 DNA-binding MarR family transcriptional regulator [Cryobacterium psychrotolerans]
MAQPAPLAHTLTGFPAAATLFVSALDANRQRIAQDSGVSATELGALFRVGRSMSIPPKDLAHHLGMTNGAITAIARRLVDANLLHRVAHPGDRRSLYLELTQHGHDVMSGIHRDFSEMLAACTTSLTAMQLTAFTEALTSVAAQVRTRSARP